MYKLHRKFSTLVYVLNINTQNKIRFNHRAPIPIPLKVLLTDTTINLCRFSVPRIQAKEQTQLETKF